MGNVIFSASDLNGSNGFLIANYSQVETRDVASAGDVNGDGFSDIIIGAPREHQGYVVFGSSVGFATIDLTDLNGANGSIISDSSFTEMGSSVASAGDINGDGFDDLLLGAPVGGAYYNGVSYVIFGSSSGFGPSFNVGNLNGSNGFVVAGFADYDFSGSVSSAGDFNGDGIDDLMIGAARADPNGMYNAGASYVVFGTSNAFGASFDIGALNGANGIAINGAAAGDYSGGTVRNAGDVNGDGIDDLLIGASQADPNGAADAGSTFVVFGSTAGFSASLELSALDVSNGFAVHGIAPGDSSGASVADAGDINGDGVDDFIIGAPSADPNGAANAGASYVVFGSTAGFAESIDLSSLDGSNGFAITGVISGDRSGSSVSGAGDINGDGFADLLIGAPQSYGETYVVFGSSNAFGATVDLSALNGANGFTIQGFPYGEVGASVDAAGDINGDGIDDLLVGSPGHTLSAFVIFGSTAFGSGGGGNAPPVARPDSFATDENTIITGNVLVSNGTGADADPDGDPITVVAILGDPALVGVPIMINRATPSGTVTIYADGTVSYDPRGAFPDVAVGLFGFTGVSYTISDGAGGTDSTSVNFAVLQTNLTEFDDLHVGNPSANIFNGLGGDDTIEGVAGNDTIDGGDGADSLLGGDGGDTLSGGLGRDTLDGGADADKASGGRDADNLSGGGGGDTLNGNGGNDTISGGAGQDRLSGEAGHDLLSGGAGDDTADGGGGNDAIFGAGGRDSLNGRSGADTLNGGSENDTLNGGAGADLLIGGPGNDRFDFAGAGFGADRITGFVAGAGAGDVIRLIGLGPAFDSFAEVLAASTQDGANTVIDFGGGDTITLGGVQKTSLVADDFLYG